MKKTTFYTVRYYRLDENCEEQEVGSWADAHWADFQANDGIEPAEFTFYAGMAIAKLKNVSDIQYPDGITEYIEVYKKRKEN